MDIKPDDIPKPTPPLIFRNGKDRDGVERVVKFHVVRGPEDVTDAARALSARLNKRRADAERDNPEEEPEAFT